MKLTTNHMANPANPWIHFPESWIEYDKFVQIPLRTLIEIHSLAPASHQSVFPIAGFQGSYINQKPPLKLRTSKETTQPYEFHRLRRFPRPIWPLMRQLNGFVCRK